MHMHSASSVKMNPENKELREITKMSKHQLGHEKIHSFQNKSQTSISIKLLHYTHTDYENWHCNFWFHKNLSCNLNFLELKTGTKQTRTAAVYGDRELVTPRTLQATGMMG